MRERGGGGRRRSPLIIAKNDLEKHAHTLSGDTTGLPPQAEREVGAASAIERDSLGKEKRTPFHFPESGASTEGPRSSLHKRLEKERPLRLKL